MIRDTVYLDCSGCRYFSIKSQIHIGGFRSIYWQTRLAHMAEPLVVVGYNLPENCCCICLSAMYEVSFPTSTRGK